MHSPSSMLSSVGSWLAPLSALNCAVPNVAEAAGGGIGVDDDSEDAGVSDGDDEDASPESFVGGAS